MLDPLIASLRAVLGASFQAGRIAPPPPPDRPLRVDPTVELTGVDADAWSIGLRISPYDLATHNRLDKVRAYLVPSGAGRPGSALDYLASSYPFAEVDLASVQAGADVTVPLPDVPLGDYFGQLVLLLNDQADAPPAPPQEPAAPTTS